MGEEEFIETLGAVLSSCGLTEVTGYQIRNFYGWEAIVESKHPEVEDHGYKLTVFFQEDGSVVWNVHYVLGMWHTNTSIGGVGAPSSALIGEIVRRYTALIS